MKKISTFLPSRTVIAFVLIPAVAIILFFVFRGLLISPEERKAMAQRNLVATLGEELTARDGDNDGLQDWEERLYKTNINKADTDGDGTLDGLEVQLGTDPLDPFNIEAKKKEKAEAEENEDEYYYKNDPNLTATDKISRDLLVKTLELKDAKLFNNTSAQDNLLNEVVIENAVVIENKYTKSSLNILENMSRASFKQKYVDIIEKYEIDSLQNDYYLFTIYSETKDKKFLEELQQNLDTYTRIEKEIATMQVAESGAPVFFEYINALGKYHDAWALLANIDDDPIGSLQTIKLIRDLDASLHLWANTLNLYFNEKDI